LDQSAENVEKMLEQITKDELMVREILATAKLLFAQHGLKKTTMEDIAHAMGKGKSTLYYYFPGKLEIFEAVVDEEMKNLLRITRRAINMVIPAQEKLKAFSRTRISVMEKFQNLSDVVYKEVFNHVGEILRLKQKHDELQVELVREIIEGGVKSGEFRELADNDIGLFSYTLVAAFRGLELPLTVSPFIKSSGHGTNVLVDMLVEGIKGK
jgi:AcrR family transcriptional regulator